jgi:GTP-binding protein HflX
VGFIRDLPHTLVEAFKATLEESVEADLLLHVVDSANPRYHEQIDDVNEVLGRDRRGGRAQLLVYNQIDRSGLAPEVVRDPMVRY